MASDKILPSVASLFDSAHSQSQLTSAYRAISPKTESSLIKYQVISRSDGNVQVAISLPESALASFIDTFAALSELTSSMNRQVKYLAAQNKPIDLKQKLETEKYLENFAKDACSIYDRFILQGADTAEAISRTRAELKKRNYAIVTYDIVKDVLRKGGKFRKVKQTTK